MQTGNQKNGGLNLEIVSCQVYQQMSVLETGNGPHLSPWDVLSPGTFCPLGLFFPGTFFPWDVFSLGRFFPGTLSPWDVMSFGTFCPWDVFSLGRFVLGRFVLGRFVLGRFVCASESVFVCKASKFKGTEKLGPRSLQDEVS